MTLSIAVELNFKKISQKEGKNVKVLGGKRSIPGLFPFILAKIRLIKLQGLTNPDPKTKTGKDKKYPADTFFFQQS